MQRVTEPEVMDSQEEAIAYDAMDFTQVNALSIFRSPLDVRAQGDWLILIS